MSRTMSAETSNVLSLRSVSQVQKAPHTSDRYAFVPTGDMLAILADHGWHPYKGKESRTRSERMQGYQRHEIRLHNPGLSGDLIATGKAMAEMRLINSHGGGSSFQLWSGLLELACLNGMVRWSETANDVRILHKGFAADLAETAIKEAAAALPAMFHERGAMLGIPLDTREQLALASAAAEVRWPTVDGKTTAPIEPSRMIVARHSEQRDSNLWNTLNRVQESLIVGGVRGRSGNGRRLTTRPVASITEDLRINRAIWRLGVEMAAIKGMPL